MLIVIIMVGIYGIPGVTGAIFTPTEAAAVASVYAAVIALFVYRDMGPLAGAGGGAAQALWRRPQVLVTAWFHRDTRATLYDAGKLTITLMFIIANALLLKQVLTEQQVPQAIATAMLDAGLGKIMFLVVVNVILLIGGQFMEPSGLIVIVAPIVFPIAIALGVDPIHLGIIMVVNMEIGMITPPVGLNLFVTSGVAGMPVMRVVRAALPFLGVLFVLLILITYVPFLSTWLPTLMMGPEIIIK
jgi:C4-dicarboxylate transporter DctM subunit